MRVLALFVCMFVACNGAADDADRRRVAFFESRIRPLFLRYCSECHNEEDSQSGLDLSSPDGIALGGKSGPLVVKGSPDASRLIQVVRYTSKIKMPPERRLPERDLEALVHWVRDGAALPHTSIEPRTVAAHGEFRLTDADRNWWAFQPLEKPNIPPVHAHDRVRTPIDAFLLARLEKRELGFSPDASRRDWLRRVTFTLTGLPPTPDELDAFLSDGTARAFERVVDRLLASPRYGERWGRHWLDVARYADTNGGGFDYVYPNAWRYRDYVVRSFNTDKPFDRFVTEQLAGDLLPTGENPDAYVDQLVATGLLTLVPKGLGMQDKELMIRDVVDDQIDVLGRSLLGLTLSCARCHDHKFDPISTRDYYALAGIFCSTVSLADVDKNPSYWPERAIEHPEIVKLRKTYQAKAAAHDRALAKLTEEANRRLLAEARRRLPEYLCLASSIHGTRTTAPAIVHWTFDEISDTTVPASAGPDGVLKNVDSAVELRPQITHGRIGNALSFSGRGDIVDVPAADSAAFQFGKTKSFSIAFWLKPADGYTPATADTVISVRYGKALWFIALRPGSYNGIYLRHYDGQRTVDVKPSVDHLPRLTNGDWHHVVFTSDRMGAGTVWIDGLQAGRNGIGSVSSAADYSGPATIRIGPSVNAFRGSLDDVAVWDRLLTGDEIRRFSAAGHTPENPRSVAEVQSAASAGLSERDGSEATYESGAQRGLIPEILTRFVSELANADEPRSPFRMLRENPPQSVSEARSFIAAAGAALQHHLNDEKRTPLQIRNDVMEFYPPRVRAKLADLKRESERLAAMRMPPAPVAMVAFDAENPADVAIAVAGDPHQPGATVPRGFPEVIGQSFASDAGNQLEINGQQSGRLQLARWLTHPKHPLTARVLVNRIWQWHFGDGLVRTSDNFGRLGERPSHPRLLDWLAASLVEGGWSIKAIHRQIVLSTVFRQASRSDRPAAHRVDTGNRLFWRMNRRRLEAEAIRDSILFVSGNLDDAVGGAVSSWKPKTFSVNDSNEETANYKTKRRSIYLPVVRGGVLHEALRLFDFGDPNSVTSKRATTTVPAQVLYLSNSPFVVEQARIFAQRIQARTDLTREQKIIFAWKLAVSWTPTPQQIERSVALLDESTEDDPWDWLCLALLNMNEFVYIE